VSVEPLETEYGRKRQINQSSCNKDYSCVNGFCPSFVTVEGGRPRKGKATVATAAADAGAPALPEPALPDVMAPYGILVTGIGGTGVVTIGQVLGMAAHLEGKGVTTLDMAGLAQKNGAVLSFIRIAEHPEQLHAPRIATGGAAAVIGGDLVTTVGSEALSKIQQGVTRIVASSTQTPTADFTRNPDWQYPEARMEQALRDAAGADRVWFADASRLALALMGDAINANLFLLGFAWQHGLVPVSRAAIERAIDLNGVAVEANLQAFLWGRRAAHDPAGVERLATPVSVLPFAPALSKSLDEIIARRVESLTDYQDAAYAARYRTLVDRVREAEAQRVPGSAALAEAVARYYYKLLAIKDEYEVARLYSRPEFMQRLAATFEGDYKLRFHLAPPLLNKPDPVTGEARKSAYGPWMMTAFRWLARFKGLRGTALGSVLGVLPGGGALLASFASYTVEKKITRNPTIPFGKGNIRGVAAPESANNAGAQTSFIPMLTLGIPPNAVMALMVGAMTIHNIQPGPQVMTSNPALFWGLIASMWIGNLMLVILNLPLIGMWVQLLKVPYRLLYPAILVFCAIGVYSINNNPFDVTITAMFGLLGYIFYKLRCEPAPLILGFILGPMMEENLRRAMLLSRGDATVFFTRPLSLGLLIAAAALVVIVALPNIKRKREEAFQEAA